MSNVAKLEQPAAEPRLLLDRKEVLNAIPTNWLDGLLTGPNAVLATSSAGKWGCPDIERLLQAVKARLETLDTMEPCDVCDGLVDSAADACPHCG